MNRNEIIIPSTLIQNITKTNSDFITSAENSYITQNVFDNAIPEITQMYNNQIVRSNINIDEVDDRDINDCIEKYSTRLLGSSSLKWNTMLPATKEMLFGNVQECSYFICQYIYKLSFSADIQIGDVKNKLWLGYKNYILKYNVAINDILSNEEKKPLIDAIKKGTSSYFSMMMDNSDYYLSLLDFIVFANTVKIPILFIHNSNLTHLRVNNNMLFTGDIVDSSKKYFIVRIHNIDKKHKFSLLSGQFFISDINNYKSIIDNYNHQTFEEIVSSYTL